MQKSYDLLGREKPIIKSESELFSEANSLKIMIEERYNTLHNLEGVLDKRLTKRKELKIILFDEGGNKSYLLSTVDKFRKVLTELDGKILELKVEEEQIEYDIKEHTIEGPDLRPWPMIQFRLVAIEEYDEKAKGHKHKGYLRYKYLNKK